MKTKKTKFKQVTSGRVYIQSTFNNTIVTITDANGNVLTSSSSGALGFKGARKTTPYAAQLATQTAVDRAKTNYKIEQVSVFVSGVGNGREAAIKALNKTGLVVSKIKDVTPVPHNGCRPKKIRRV